MMKEFLLERDLERTPTIMGIRALYFFAFVGALVFSFLLLISFAKHWLIVLVLELIALPCFYAYLYYLTEAFQANKLGDEKIPDVFSTTP